MKKHKLAKVLIPAVLIGSPAAAVSSVRSNSRFRQHKTVFAQAAPEETRADQKGGTAQDPFSMFDNRSAFRNDGERDRRNDLLAFLKDEGLATSGNSEHSTVSGEVDYRKVFSERFTCVDGAMYAGRNLDAVSTTSNSDEGGECGEGGCGYSLNFYDTSNNLFSTKSYDSSVAAESALDTYDNAYCRVPTVSGLPSDVTVTEDTESDIDLSAATFADAQGDSLTVTFTASAGVFGTPPSSGGVTGSKTSDTVITLAGAVAAINTYLDTTTNIRYTPDANASGEDQATITVEATDGTATLVSNPTINIDITAVNDAPAIENLYGDLLSYYEGDSATVVEQGLDINVTDIDSADFDDGNLTVSIVEGGVESEDILSIQSQGVDPGQIGVSGSNIVYGGTPFGILDDANKSRIVIALDEDANTTVIKSLIQAIQYENNNTVTPGEGNRTIRFILSDGDGGYNSYDTNVSVHSVNEAPTYTQTAFDLNRTLSEDFSEFNLTISGIGDEESDDLNITVDINDTSIATVGKTWSGLLAYSAYNGNDFNITITPVADASGLAMATITIDDGNATTTRDFNISVGSTTPDTLGFTGVTDAETDTEYTSNSQTVTGIDGNATISISGGSYRLDGGDWTTGDGTVANNQSLELKLTSSTDNSTQSCAIVTIGGDNNASYCVTTKAVGGSSGGGTANNGAGTGGTTGSGGGGFTPNPKPDVVTVVDPDQGVDEPVVIDQVDTGETIGAPGALTTGEDGTQSVNVGLSGGGSTTLSFAPGSGPLNATTTETGYEASATLTTPLGSHVTTSAKVNNNGTLKAVVTVSGAGGTKETRVNSLKTGTNLTTNDDGTVEASYNDSGVQVKAGVGSAGETTHEVDVIDTEGNTVATKASSKVSGSTVTILEDGTVQTRASVSGVDGGTVEAVVDGKSSGQATHLLKVTDGNGNTVSTKATSEVAGAQTTIEEDGGVETSVNNISVKAQPDGKAIHTVNTIGGASTRATSNIKGAFSTINSGGGVTTSVQSATINSQGEEITVRAVVVTGNDGTSLTRFEQVNLTTGEVETLDNTVSESTPLEEGNTVEITREGNTIYMDAETKVTKEMTFE